MTGKGQEEMINHTMCLSIRMREHICAQNPQAFDPKIPAAGFEEICVRVNGGDGFLICSARARDVLRERVELFNVDLDLNGSRRESE